MAQVTVQVAGVAVSNPVPIDLTHFAPGVGLLVTIPATQTATYTVQISGDPNGSTPTNWNNHDVLVSQTASNSSNLATPVSFVRLNVTAASGPLPVVMNVVQVERENWR